MLVIENLNKKEKKKRLPIIKINSKNIKYMDKFRYLRITVDEKLNFIAHARYRRTKIIQFMSSIKRIALEKWGIKSDILKVLYS